MAQVIMTNAQKELLKVDSSFQSEVKWGILNKAAYWMGQDGTGQVGATALKRWANSRHFAALIQLNPGMAAPTDQVLNQFLIFAKTITVWDNVANTTAAAVAYMLANSTFDTLADNWFDSQIATNPF